MSLRSLFKFVWNLYETLQTIWQTLIWVGFFTPSVLMGAWAHFQGMSPVIVVFIAIGVLALVLIIVTCGLYISFFFLDRRKGRNENQSSKPSHAIDIVIGHDGHYVETHSHHVYNVMKTVLVGIRNAGPAYLSNCKVYLETIKAETNAPEKWLLENTFSLNPGEERFVGVASFNEAVPPHPPEKSSLIRPCYPPSGTFWQPPMLPQSGGFLTIRALSAESSPCEVICRLWVEDNKLHWEKV